MPLLLAVSVLSAAVLGYEILLMRLLSIVQWHHFASMIISLALLGYGASGAFLSLARTWALARFTPIFAASAALFGVSTVVAFAAAQRVPFNPLELVWDPWQWLHLATLYLILTVPFFFAATALGLAYTRFRDRIGALYGADLGGAGVGALGIVAILFAVAPERGLVLLCGAGIVAGGLVMIGPGRRGLAAVGVMVVGVLSPLAWPDALLALRPSPYKELSQTLEVPGTEVLSRLSSPLGVLTVVRSPTIPFRHAPGLSLLSDAEVPEQLGVFTDGGGMTAITRYRGAPEEIAYLGHRTSALPHHLLKEPRVLVLGAGGGSDLLLARYHGARAIDAVELNPQMVALLRRDHADFAGGPYAWPEVRVHVAEGRGFAATGGEPYDLIQLTSPGSFAASAAGLYALNQSALYTVEAFRTYLGRLAPGGFLAVTGWFKVPPRDSLKLVAIAAAAMTERGVPEPGRRVILIRGWNTFTLLIKNGDVSADEEAIVRAFCGRFGFDVAHLPGLSPGEANRRNRLDRPYLYEGARALLGERGDAFIEDYKFDIAPSTDDRPYFFHFFKWGVLEELLALRAVGGLALVEWGYLILVATLVQATLLSAVLILLPLKALKRIEPEAGAGPGFGRVLVYFGALGLGFLFVEIAFMERFVLFLSHPLYAIAVVLCGFLLFAGMGSALSSRLAARAGGWAIALAVCALAGLALAYLLLLPPLFEASRSLSEPAKVATTLALIAPLAFFMGMPFPLGLGRVARGAPRLVPWAWGINGCASVLSAVLANLLAIEFGFSAVILTAVVLYGLAASAFSRREGPGRQA